MKLPALPLQHSIPAPDRCMASGMIGINRGSTPRRGSTDNQGTSHSWRASADRKRPVRLRLAYRGSVTTGGQFDSGERESGMAPVSLWVRLARPIELWRNPQRERRTNYPVTDCGHHY